MSKQEISSGKNCVTVLHSIYKEEEKNYTTFIGNKITLTYLVLLSVQFLVYFQQKIELFHFLTKAMQILKLYFLLK